MTSKLVDVRIATFSPNQPPASVHRHLNFLDWWLLLWQAFQFQQPWVAAGTRRQRAMAWKNTPFLPSTYATPVRHCPLMNKEKLSSILGTIRASLTDSVPMSGISSISRRKFSSSLPPPLWWQHDWIIFTGVAGVATSTWLHKPQYFYNWWFYSRQCDAIHGSNYFQQSKNNICTCKSHFKCEVFCSFPVIKYV